MAGVEPRRSHQAEPEHADGCLRGSPIHHVDGLIGDLLRIHGTGDDNVHYQRSEALINAMIERNKHLENMPPDPKTIS